MGLRPGQISVTSVLGAKSGDWSHEQSIPSNEPLIFETILPMAKE